MGTLVKKRFNMQCHLILSNEILFLIFLIQKKIRSLVGDSTRMNLISIMSFRSSHQRYSIQKGILKNFTKFPGKHLCQNLFFNKDAGLRLATLLKNRPWYSCFRNTYSEEHLRTVTSGLSLSLFLMCGWQSFRKLNNMLDSKYSVIVFTLLCQYWRIKSIKSFKIFTVKSLHILMFFIENLSILILEN